MPLSARKAKTTREKQGPGRPVAGMEAEFTLFVDGAHRLPIAREIANPFRGAIQEITPARVYEHLFAVIVRFGHSRLHSERQQGTFTP